MLTEIYGGQNERVILYEQSEKLEKDSREIMLINAQESIHQVHEELDDPEAEKEFTRGLLREAFELIAKYRNDSLELTEPV